jgi:hypothetical protein
MKNDQNAVVRALLHRVGFCPDGATVEQAVLKYGRPFIGTERPKRYLLGVKKNCFRNSFYVAAAERGFYVEGYALSGPGGLFHHAWITIDGIHAVDLTLRGSIPDYQFFGVAFPLRVLNDEIEIRQGYLPLLDWAHPLERMEDLLQRATRLPPDYGLGMEPRTNPPTI